MLSAIIASSPSATPMQAPAEVHFGVPKTLTPLEICPSLKNPPEIPIRYTSSRRGERAYGQRGDVLRALYTILFSLVLVAAASCNGADFGGTNSRGSPSEQKNCDGEEPCSATTTPTTPDGPPGAGNCVDGDQLKLEWSGPIKECLIDQGKTYNFELKQCTEMRQAKFTCNWENVTKALEELGLLTNTLKTDSQNGAKLVSCGQSEDGNRIVVQWVKPPEGGAIDCSKANGGSLTTTGCYTYYGPGETQPPEPANEEERKKQVYGCMNQL